MNNITRVVNPDVDSESPITHAQKLRFSLKAPSELTLVKQYKSVNYNSNREKGRKSCNIKDNRELEQVETNAQRESDFENISNLLLS